MGRKPSGHGKPKKPKARGRRNASRKGGNIRAIMQSKKDGGVGRGW